MAAAPDHGEHRINDRIRAREVRLVDSEGKQLGIKSLNDALQIARQADLDLVEVAPEANPPVCRIMDFGKFKFDAAQRAKESRRKTTSSSIKEMKYRPKIGTGDFDTKTRQVARFLGEGHKVKITIMFRGREMSHPELGKKILDLVAVKVGPVAKVEAAPKLDGRNMIMVLAPDKRAQQAGRRSEEDDSPEAGLVEGQPARLQTVGSQPVGSQPSVGLLAPSGNGTSLTLTPAKPVAPRSVPARPAAAAPAAAASTAAASTPVASTPAAPGPVVASPATVSANSAANGAAPVAPAEPAAGGTARRPPAPAAAGAQTTPSAQPARRTAGSKPRPER